VPFTKIDASVPDFPALERSILALWKERDVFHRSLQQTEGAPEFVFYEGPPTANGLPHNGHVLTRVVKDLFPRYRTMRGQHVPRRAGWDTHGLPVEVEVEKELRISGRAAILEYGVDRYVRKCLDSVFRYTEEWERMTERVGYWVDLDRAYVTYHKSYVESVWWALAQLFEKGLLYKGHKVVWWWAQGGTALSAGEVGGAYRTVDDPSVYVRLPLRDEDASLVVWTTTPWTLPSNMFAAVHPDFEYAYARDADRQQTYVLAKDLVETLAGKLGRPLAVVRTVRGLDLIGKRYLPPFDAFARDVGEDDERYWRVVPGNRAASGTPQWFVTLDAGTGIVHLAPAFGEDDWKVWRSEQQRHPGLEMFCAVRPDGTLDHRLSSLELEGVWVKDADKALIRWLGEQGLLVHRETFRHEYPFCWRSDDDPLIQYAREAWFIRTTSKLDLLLANNQKVAWAPEHIKDGRFGDFLASNVDWALSRERFWGTPLNVWECGSCGASCAPTSCADIESRNKDAFRAFHEARAQDPTLSEHLIVHKPWIDEVAFPCSDCGATMRRVPEVIDCWFDSGCMPFAQLGYPHAPGSREQLELAFPADFISEAIDQTRGWFYSLMAVSTLVFEGRPLPHPYRRCIVLGHVLDQTGKKESKSSGNYTPPEVILEAVRMEFAPLPPDAAQRLGVSAPAAGSAWVGRDDLQGLDLEDGCTVALYRREEPKQRHRVTLRAHKKLPRRVIVLADADRAALQLGFGPADVMPVEVPKLAADRRVTVEYEGMPAPGADAFRWFFCASNPPWNSTRHSLANVRSLQKELPIKLRNVYAFLVTYANIDGFEPAQHEKQARPPRQRALLDRWILSELARTNAAVIEHLDAFRIYEATQALTAFVDGLSNWYVRRSRERFWVPGLEQDKVDAYATLYRCVRDTAVMLAPFTPFGSEDMYQNLVVQQFGSSVPDSVHLAPYPTPDESALDPELSQDMAAVRELVSLGLQVRASNKIKVRQPLRRASIVLSEPARESTLRGYADIMREELNVKHLAFETHAERLVSYRVRPNLPVLGKRLGPRLKATQQALAAADPNALKRALDAQGEVELDAAGDKVVLTADELLVTVEAKEGFAAASSLLGVVILETTLDDELIADGLFREVLAKVQAQRKELRLDYDRRIALRLAGSDALLAICRARADELKRETLTEDLVLGQASEGAAVTEIDGQPLRIEVVA
jgi:isoleucyl-tRNA synthetase